MRKTDEAFAEDHWTFERQREFAKVLQSLTPSHAANTIAALEALGKELKEGMLSIAISIDGLADPIDRHHAKEAPDG